MQGAKIAEIAAGEVRIAAGMTASKYTLAG